MSFDVVRAEVVTNVLFTADAASRGPGDLRIADAPIAITGLFPVEADGRFGGAIRAQQTTVELKGCLNGSEQVSGMLCVDVILVYRGTPRRCSTGKVDWSVRLVPPAC